MALSKTLPDQTLAYFVRLVIYDSDDGATSVLRLGSVDFTDAEGIVNSEAAHWQGRLSKGRVKIPMPKIFSSAYAHPTFTCSVTTDDVGDSYAFWTSWMGTEKRWTGASAQVFIVDMENGQVKTEMGGTNDEEALVTVGPRSIRRGDPFSLTITGGYPSLELPNPVWSMPSETQTGYVEPVIQQDTTLDGAISATQTTITLNAAVSVTNQQIGRVWICEEEAMYQTAWNVFAKTITVIRGYAGTTAASHIDISTITCHRNGLGGEYAKSETEKECLPFVFGEQAALRGIIFEVTPQGKGHSSGTGEMEMYISRGAGPKVNNAWATQTGYWWDWTPTDTWNDYDDAFNAGDPHTEPMPPALLQGSYLADLEYEDPNGSNEPWDPDSDRCWVRVAGITNDETETGDIHRYPVGIAQYLATNSRWACGLTAPWVAGIVATWNTGTWQSEYTEDYAANLQGILPAWGTAEPPLFADAISDLCRAVNADLLYKRGTLYPKKRELGTTSGTPSTWTPSEMDLIGGYPEMQFDPAGDYCNLLTVNHAQAILSQPKNVGGDVRDPMDVPYSVDIRDDTSITENNGVIVRKTYTTKWFRWKLSADWTPYTIDEMQIAHLDYLDELGSDLLDLLSVPQVYIKATFPMTYLLCEQGDQITYDIPGYPTTAGQVREIDRDLDAMTNTVTSWHSEGL